MKGLIDKMAELTKSNNNINNINKIFNIVKPSNNAGLDNIDKMLDMIKG